MIHSTSFDAALGQLAVDATDAAKQIRPGEVNTGKASPSLTQPGNRSTAEDFVLAAKNGGTALFDRVMGYMPVGFEPALRTEISVELGKGLKNMTVKPGISEQQSVVSALNTLRENAIEARGALESKLDTRKRMAAYQIVEWLNITADLANKAARMAQDEGNQEIAAVAQDSKNFQSAKQAIVDTARNSVESFQRPKDIGCAMSILSWREVRYAFGSMVANEYIGVEVVVRNLNEKEDFVLHDAEFEVNSDINGRIGRYYSGRDKVIVRGLSLAQQNANFRNLLVHSAEAVGTLMSAVIPVAGDTFKDAAGVFNGGFLPGLRSTWPDLSVTQLNLLNDVGFSSTTNYKTVVPKSGSVMFVMFIPSKQFNQGWWTQKCVDGIGIKGDLQDRSQQASASTKSTTPSQLPGLGIDLSSARQQCLTYLRALNVNSSEANLPTQPQVSQATANPKKMPVLIKDALNNLTLIAAKPVPYKSWSPNGLSIFRELAFAVVAGAHIQEDTQKNPVVSNLDCVRDSLGNVQFGAIGTPISCDVTGANLDKVASLRLRNADDATDTNTAEGSVSISGDSTKGKVSFPDDKFCALPQSTYKVYAITSTTAELATNQTLHFDPRPIVRSLDPNECDPNQNATVKFTLKGCHLQQISEVHVSGAGKQIANTIDSGGTPAQVSFTVDSSKGTLKADAKTAVGFSAELVLLVKPPLSGQVDPGKSITFRTLADLQAASGSAKEALADSGKTQAKEKKKQPSDATPASTKPKNRTKGRN